MKGKWITALMAGAVLAGCGAQVPVTGTERTVLQRDSKVEDQTVALTIRLGSSVNPATATVLSPEQRARAMKIRDRTDNLGRANWLALLASMHAAIKVMTMEEFIKQSKSWSKDPEALLTFVDTHLTKAEALSPKDAQASASVFADDDFMFTYELSFGTKRPESTAKPMPAPQPEPAARPAPAPVPEPVARPAPAPVPEPAVRV